MIPALSGDGRWIFFQGRFPSGPLSRDSKRCGIFRARNPLFY
jgi:hypothetical protein